MKLAIRMLSHLLLSAWVAFSATAQEQQTQAAPAKSASGFQLEDATPLRLRLQQTITSADAQVDDRVNFDVLEEIRVNDVVVIPKGSLAWATITEAQSKRRLARGGKLAVNIDAVRLADGEKVALRAVKDAKGGGHEGAMTGAMVATGIVFFPAAPLFLFMHGKDVTIPKGTEVTAYINGAVSLDPAKFGAVGTGEAASAAAASAAPVSSAAPASAPSGPSAPASEASAPAAPQGANPARAGEPSTVAVKSTPDGADITVDGKYVGSTPSTLRLAVGDHAIVVEKAGFKSWQRTVTVSEGGNINVDATLEKAE